MRRSPSSIFNYWLRGIRLYIAIAAILITVEGWWWASIGYGGELSAIRLEELYAWLSLLLLIFAMSIGPFYKIFPKTRAKQLIFDSRRMLGVAAGWFALLHFAIVYDVLFKLSNPIFLPERYKLPTLVGFAALVILLIMMATSFDAAQKNLKKWWFRIHRLVYLAALLILLHTFMIGSHALKPTTFGVLILTALIVYILESLAVLLTKKSVSGWQITGLAIGFILLAITVSYGVTKFYDTNFGTVIGFGAQKT